MPAEHLCHFYRSRAELLQSLVPYFATGLANHERCVFVASQLFSQADVRDALRVLVPDLAAREASGQLEILEPSAWRDLDAEQVIAKLLEREEAALHAGYTGLRLNGEASWLAEHKAADALRGRKICALCSYSLADYDSHEVVDVMKHHGAALIYNAGALRPVHSATAVLAYAAGEAAPERHGHTVEFYRAGEFPAASVARAMRASLLSGRAAVALARSKHLDTLRDALRALGVDIHASMDSGALRLIDACAVADASLHEGRLDLRAVEQMVLEPMAASLRRHGRIYAFGELVDVFVERRERDAALALEKWWNQQVAAHPIKLHCAYCLNGFADAASVEPFRHICDAHDDVCEDESATVAPTRLLAEIDQLSAALTTESRMRSALEPTREHLLAVQQIAAQLGEAITVADVSRVIASAGCDRLGATRVALFVEELGRWHDLISDRTQDTLPAGAIVLRVRDHDVGALALDFPIDMRRNANHRALVHDVVQQTAFALDRARAYDAAEQASRVKDEFLAMLGHELRNPLAPIVTALQLMRMRGDAHLLKERAVIERQVGSLVRLIDDLLDVSRITRGKVTIERRTSDLADVVNQALEQATAAISEAGHHLEIDIESGIVLEIDPDRLAQVIANLLGNAAKYTPPGGRIDLRVRSTPARVRIEVSDNGIGIEPTLLPRIFELFVQGRQGRDRSRGGLGLGLAISRAIVDLHGGTISAVSAGAGLGTTVTVELPRLPHVRLQHDPAGTSRDRARMRVLLVDDNRDAGQMLAEALRELGHDVHLAHDGKEGLRVAVAIRPHVAILDLGLPEIDGYELARRLRHTLANECPRLVALTGYGQPADRRLSAETGFAAHLVKPVVVDQLDAALRGLGN
jgi:signal transduction histidine kinase